MTKNRKEYELLDKNELMNFKKIAKSWDFTCPFCFKMFDSAQSMGGHQNAHRKERNEEKRLHVKGYIGRRMLTYLQANKSKGGSSNTTEERVSSHAPTAKSSVVPGPSKARVLPVSAFLERDESKKFNDSLANINGGNLKSEAGFAAKNKLLSLGIGAMEEVDSKGKTLIHEINNVGYAIGFDPQAMKKMITCNLI